LFDNINIINKVKNVEIRRQKATAKAAGDKRPREKGKTERYDEICRQSSNNDDRRQLSP